MFSCHAPPPCFVHTSHRPLYLRSPTTDEDPGLGQNILQFMGRCVSLLCTCQCVCRLLKPTCSLLLQGVLPWLWSPLLWVWIACWSTFPCVLALSKETTVGVFGLHELAISWDLCLLVVASDGRHVESIIGFWEARRCRRDQLVCWGHTISSAFWSLGAQACALPRIVTGRTMIGARTNEGR